MKKSQFSSSSALSASKLRPDGVGLLSCSAEVMKMPRSFVNCRIFKPRFDNHHEIIYRSTIKSSTLLDPLVKYSKIPKYGA